MLKQVQHDRFITNFIEEKCYRISEKHPASHFFHPWWLRVAKKTIYDGLSLLTGGGFKSKGSLVFLLVNFNLAEFIFILRNIILQRL